MRLPRSLSLLAGTVGLIGICYALAAPVRSVAVSAQRPLVVATVGGQKMELEQRCQIATEKLRRESWAVLIRAPYVLTGDLPAAQLDELFQETILPTARALAVDYFDQTPTEPIVIVLLASEAGYRQALERIGQSRRAEYSGLYQRDERTIWINLSTGVGTLAHELTHALAHADFPELPEWFDEGLASLHEESEFSPDGLHLVGRDNWRLEFLREADARNRWTSVAQLLEEPFARPDKAAVDYALARNLCLYLQDRGLLAPFYRKCRSRFASDTTGTSALLRLFPGRTIDELDQEFRLWVRARESSPSGSPKR